MKSSSKSLTSIGLVIAVLAVAYFGVYGQWGKLAAVREVYKLAEAENTRLADALKDSTAFLANFENSQGEAILAERVLPMTKPDVPILLDNVSKLVQESGLNLIQLNFFESSSASEEGSSPNSIRSVDFDIQAKGTYEAYKDFLLRVQRNMRLMDLISMTTAADRSENNTANTLDYVLKLRTYYQQ